MYRLRAYVSNSLFLTIRIVSNSYEAHKYSQPNWIFANWLKTLPNSFIALHLYSAISLSSGSSMVNRPPLNVYLLSICDVTCIASFPCFLHQVKVGYGFPLDVHSKYTDSSPLTTCNTTQQNISNVN